MTAFYNEFDPGAAAWLRELIAAGLIAPGVVDERSILDLKADDLAGFSQCHFFAGIGGWSYALRLAGWPDDRPVWTGSPPCQPFSSAGRQKGRDDERHLAPHFIDLVRACRPRVLFGEQVASSDVFGKAAKRARGKPIAPPQWAWLDDLSDRLEAARYAVGAVDFPSAGIGAPHIRQRTFFGAVDLERLGDADSNGAWRIGGSLHCEEAGEGWRGCGHDAGASGDLDGLADCYGQRRVPGAQRGIHCSEEGAGSRHGEPERFGDAGGLGNSQCARLEGLGGHGNGGSEPGRIDQDTTGPAATTSTAGGLANDPSERRCGRQSVQDGRDNQSGGSNPLELNGRSGIAAERPCQTNCFWSAADWLFCRDGKWRPVEPGTFPLAHGVSGRVGLLRGYGNAINPWAAKEFIEAFDQTIEGLRHFRMMGASEMTANTGDIFG